MKTIWKYIVPVIGVQEAEMPEGAQILSIQMQGAQLALWALVDPAAPRTVRRFFIFGTGHVVTVPEAKTYLATVQDPLGLVWHIFEGATEPVTVSANG